MKNFLILAILILTLPQFVFAWGGRGHDSICQAAVHLVKNKELANFLKSRPHVMGHLCNIPDIQWRNLDRKITQYGDPNHYVNPEVIGLAVQDIPTDLNVIVEKYTDEQLDKQDAIGKSDKIASVPTSMGTNWWRADQMVRRGIENGKKAAVSEAPTNSKQAQDDELPYNKAVYEMIISMGIMGHFVGDNAQPFHNTSDYDGYAANQGGIHSYYEEQSVAHLGSDLVNNIVQKAKKLKNTKFMSGQSPVEKMRSLAVFSVSEIKAVLKADPIVKNSTFKLEKGMSLKTPADRQSAEVGARKFEKLIVEQMGRAALLLASFWDQIYTESGAPELKPYRSYRYPLTVDFIMPDYYKIEVENSKK